MKVETRVLDYASTLEGERIGMTIDEGALSHIMAVLTDLYSDPEMAVLREYATNALDSHVEAGQRRPIEVTLPSSLSPFLRVRDYGIGLDAEGIRSVFSRYGTSTKRQSNDVVGMLGLGCKSALTYADQFTLVGVKDGVRVQVLVSRDEDGSGSMTIADESPSDDAPGVEVVIPAKRENDFAAKAEGFFRFWQPGTVLVNGAAPKRIGGLWLADDLLLTTECDADCVVMGNVPYPFTDDASRGKRWGAPAIVAFVPIGSVTFTPSRESLQATKRTAATLEAVKVRAESELEAAVIRQCAAASSPSEAQRLLREGQRSGFKGAATYQGRPVLQTFDRAPKNPNASAGSYWRAPDASDCPDDSFLTIGTPYSKRKGERTWQVKADEAGTHFFVNFDGRDMTPTKREKLEVWASEKGLTLGQCTFVRSLHATERFWIDAARVHDWAAIDAVKLTRESRAANVNGRPRGSYDAYVQGTWATVQAADIDDSQPLYWLQGNQHSVGGHPAVRAKVIDVAGCTIVPLPGNRVEKFCRDFPTAVNLTQAGRTAAAAQVAALDADEVRAWRMQRGTELTVLRSLDPDRFTDPHLQSLTRTAAVKTDAVGKLAQSLQSVLGDATALAPIRDDWQAAYPLLANRYGGRLPADHIYAYANAAYALQKGAAA